MRIKLSHEKWICHVTCVKWTKFDRKCHLKNTILGTKFCPFYTGHMTSSFFMGQLSTHLACQDVRAKFSFEFFRKVLKLFFAPSKNGSKCSQEPKLPSPNVQQYKHRTQALCVQMPLVRPTRWKEKHPFYWVS